MKKLIYNIKNRPFVVNVLTLMTGTVIAQCASVITYPIITRLYTPENFGLYDLFISLFTILASIVTLKYEQSIVIPKDKNHSFLLFKISIFFSIVISLLFLLIIIFFANEFSAWMGNYLIKPYLYLIPVMVMVTGIFYSVKYYALRIQAFKDISIANASQSLLSSFFQIIAGFFKAGSIGLIGSQIISATPVYLATYRKLARPPDNFIRKGQWRKRKKQYILLIKKYIEFPKYSIAATLANSLVIYCSSIFVFKIFSAEILGYLSLANRLLTIPLILFGTAIADTFLQKASSEIHSIGNAKNIFFKALKTTSILAVIGVAIGFFFITPIFTFFFGIKWRMAGYYSSILIFLFGIRFIASPLANIFIVYKRQKALLIITVSQLMALIGLFSYTVHFNINFITYVYIYVVSQSIFYIIIIIKAWHYSTRGLT